MFKLAGPPSGEYYIYLALIAFSVLANITVSLILITKKRHSITVATFVLFLMSFALWGAGVLMINVISLTNRQFEVMHDAIALGYIMMPIWLYLFAYTYTGREAKPLRYRLIIFLVSSMLIFLYLGWTTEYLKGHTFEKSFITEWGPQTVFGPLYIVLLLWIMTLLVLSFSMIFRDFRNSLDPLRKIQSKSIVIAISIPLVIGTTTDAILPLLHVAAFPSTVPMTSLMSIVIAYAILRYGLFELSFENLLASVNVPIITMGISNEILTMNSQARNLLKLKDYSFPEMSIEDVIKDEPKRKHGHAYIRKLLRESFMSKKNVRLRNISLIKSNGDKVRVSLMVIPVVSENQVNAANLVVYSKGYGKKPLFREDEILSVATHEIKTPLTNIKWIAEILLKAAQDRHDAISSDYLTRMYTQLNMMTKLINDYMEVARLERGQVQLMREKTDVSTLVNGVVENIKTLTENHKLKIHNDKSTFANVDIDKMSQVMVNLITNAVKYSPDGTTIFIRTKKQLNAVCIEIEDNGMGIAKKEQKNIFKSYYRVNSKVGKTAGLGLGLYISKKIVDMHKGKITLVSEIGRGTTFKIYLPSANV